MRCDREPFHILFWRTPIPIMVEKEGKQIVIERVLSVPVPIGCIQAFWVGGYFAYVVV